MEGFFKPAEMKKDRRKLLPPKLKVELPATEAKKSKPVEYVSPKIPQLIMDIECYVNYFLVRFLKLDGDMFISYEQTKDHPLAIPALLTIIKKYEIITFNGENYDIPMLRLALSGVSNRKLKQVSDLIIKSDQKTWQIVKGLDLPRMKFKHIDLIELIKGKLSLKMYGGRLHCDKMQDLPIEAETVLTDDQMTEIEEYCGNDLNVTKLLFLARLQQIELRRTMSKKYKLDLMSKSDAQIAEAVIKSEIEILTKKELEKPDVGKKSFLYKLPSNIKFRCKVLNDALHIVTTKRFDVDYSGNITMPEELTSLKVNIGHSTYNMGMGGLHSTEKSAYHIEDDEYTLHDFDVASFYPEIILKLGLYPKQMGKHFIPVFGTIVTERLEAKRSGDKSKADSLKIVINGSFGKFGSPYSYLFAPDLMIQVTVSGQLYLLMLVEMLEERGFSVVSGNTDGIVIKCLRGKESLMYRIVKHWEKVTGFTMEETKYAGIFSRDINNYIAILHDGYVKTKGIFAPPSLDDKNPDSEICSIAMIDYIKFGTPFEQTIKSCYDIRKFVSIRTVKGGAEKDGVYLGKAVRFYHAKGVKGGINYVLTGNTVANSEGVRPIMNISGEFPKDIDYDWYVDRCLDLFKTKGDDK